MSWLSSFGDGFDFKDLGTALGLHGIKGTVNHIENSVGLHGFNGMGKASGTNALGALLIVGGAEAMGAMGGAEAGAGAAGGSEAGAGASAGGSGFSLSDFLRWGKTASSVASAAGGSGGDKSQSSSPSSGGSNMGFLSDIVSSVGGSLIQGGLGNAFGGSTSSVSRSSAASAADPFAGQRDQYQQMLQQMMSGQGGFSTSDPSYQWRFGQGQQAVERSMGGAGLLNSGNFLTALTDYGQGQASSEYGNQFSRLARLSGADIGSPSSAAQILAGQQSAQNQSFGQFGNMIGGQLGKLVGGENGGGGGGGLGSIFSSIGSMFGGSGGGSDFLSTAGSADSMDAMASFA